MNNKKHDMFSYIWTICTNIIKAKFVQLNTLISVTAGLN